MQHGIRNYLAYLEPARDEEGGIDDAEVAVPVLFSAELDGREDPG